MVNIPIIQATFIGEDGSMGYKTGERYLLWVEENRIRPNPGLGAKPCPYGSVAAFLSNWTDIEPYDRPAWMRMEGDEWNPDPDPQYVDPKWLEELHKTRSVEPPCDCGWVGIPDHTTPRHRFLVQRAKHEHIWWEFHNYDVPTGQWHCAEPACEFHILNRYIYKEDGPPTEEDVLYATRSDPGEWEDDETDMSREELEARWERAKPVNLLRRPPLRKRIRCAIFGHALKWSWNDGRCVYCRKMVDPAIDRYH